MAERRLPYLDHPGPIPFAHRGGSAEAPENTMGAFQRAVDLGYRYLETDVWATADGVLVAFHDERLERVTDGTGRVADRHWADLRRLTVRGSAEGVPRFEDVLGAWPGARINVDIKHDAAVPLLTSAIGRCGAHDRVCLAAFSGRRLAEVRRLTGGRVATSMGPLEVARLRRASWGLPAGRLTAACAQVPLRRGRVRLVDPAFLAAARRRGIPVHVWTIDDRAEMERLLDLGVDGIMTDRPALLREVLVARGQWA